MVCSNIDTMLLLNVAMFIFVIFSYLLVLLAPCPVPAGQGAYFIWKLKFIVNAALF